MACCLESALLLLLLHLLGESLSLPWSWPLPSLAPILRDKVGLHEGD